MYIYVMGDEAGHSKVGISKAPKRRLSGVRNGNPTETRIFYTHKVNTTEAAPTEKAIHKLLSSVRTRGEWFAVHPVIARQAVLAAFDPAERPILDDLLTFHSTSHCRDEETYQAHSVVWDRLRAARPGLLGEINPWNEM